MLPCGVVACPPDDTGHVGIAAQFSNLLALSVDSLVPCVACHADFMLRILAACAVEFLSKVRLHGASGVQELLRIVLKAKEEGNLKERCVQ